MINQPSDRALSVVLIDDDRYILASLSTILEAGGNVSVAATSTSGRDVLALYRQYEPDVMLLDIRMPEVSGLAAAEELLAAHPQATVVFLTTFADDDYLVRALTLGARGYLIKQEAASLESVAVRRRPRADGARFGSERTHRPADGAHRHPSRQRPLSRFP